MKISLLASSLILALGSAPALAQNAAAGLDDASRTAGSSLERSSQSYDSGNAGRDAAKRVQGSGTTDGMAGDSAAAGSATGTAGSSTAGTSAAGTGMSGDSTAGSGATGTTAAGSSTVDTGAAGAQGTAMDSSQPMTGSPGTTTTFSGTSADTTGSGAAGRAYDGSKASGPASRAEVVADRDRALRSERWIFNDLDGVRRLDPGENSLAGRVYKGPADNY